MMAWLHIQPILRALTDNLRALASLSWGLVAASDSSEQRTGKVRSLEDRLRAGWGVGYRRARGKSPSVA